ncbi:hypothetical protein DITRI_Ditri03aG0211900 [Diplodiscus trichospermus]
MSSLSERSVMHIFGVTTMVIMALMMPMIATDQSSPSSPLSSPASLLFHPVENKNQLEGERETSYHLLLQQEQDQKANFLDDYGVWNPTPRSSGANPSPVPHAKARRFSTSLTRSSRG